MWLYHAVHDVACMVYPRPCATDQAEKEAARAALFAADGACTALLTKIEGVAAGGGRMVADKKGSFTIADMWAFWIINFLRCGFWDGISADYLDAAQYPKLTEVEAVGPAGH